MLPVLPLGKYREIGVVAAALILSDEPLAIDKLLLPPPKVILDDW